MGFYRDHQLSPNWYKILCIGREGAQVCPYKAEYTLETGVLSLSEIGARYRATCFFCYKDQKGHCDDWKAEKRNSHPGLCLTRKSCMRARIDGKLCYSLHYGKIYLAFAANVNGILLHSAWKNSDCIRSYSQIRNQQSLGTMPSITNSRSISRIPEFHQTQGSINTRMASGQKFSYSKE